MATDTITASRGGAVAAQWPALLLWAAVVAVAGAVGVRLNGIDPRMHIGAAPLVGSYDLRLGSGMVPAAALGLAGAVWGPALAARLRFGGLLATAWGASAAWAVALASAGGAGAIAQPLTRRYEYLAAIDRVGSPGTFLRRFLTELPTYPTHVRGHPPGMVLVLWALDRVGLGGAGPAAALVIGVGALTVPAALIALRELAGAAQARAAAPFAVLVPGAVWMATSADALFAGVLAVGAALFALACTRRGRTADGFAAAAGLTFGAGLMLTYGALPFGAIVTSIALARRRVRPLVIAGAGVAAVLGTFWALGFFWPDGLRATRDIALAGVVTRRPYAAFLLISVAAFALAAGPASAVGLARLRDRGTWILVGGALVAVALADISGLSRGETERIWLPFLPWIAIAAAGLGRGWLGAQVLLALALQAGVRSPW